MAYSAEEEAVLAVVREHGRAFWMRDFEAYANCHAHEPETLRWAYWQAGGLIRQRGWEIIGKRARTAIDRLERPLPELASAPLENITVRVRGDMAWVAYDRPNPRRSMLPSNLPADTFHSLKVLERFDGAWRIVATCVFNRSMGEAPFVAVDADLRIVWTSETAAELLVDDEHFVVRGGRLRLRDTAADARLRAMVRAAAAQGERLMPVRTTTPLVLGAGTGVTRTAWLTTEGGMPHVLLADQRPLAGRIEPAALVYGLSASQGRLAVALCEGQSVPDFARASGITTNTARTHLRRMLDKVGASSQTGLVRALLSLTPPY